MLALLGSFIRLPQRELAIRSTHGRAPHSGAPLPPPALRKGGKHFLSNDRLISQSEHDVERLEAYAGLRDGLHIVDLGSGPGRLAIALLERNFTIRYTGIDVQSPPIRWGSRHITTFNPSYTFVTVDSPNRRYNPGGRAPTKWPLEESSADLVYAYSVLSHMASDEVRFQFEEAARVLHANGTLTLTAFVEDACPEESVNPADYGPLAWKGQCHCVRYQRSYFIGLAESCGFVLHHFFHNSDTDGQSFLVFGRV